MRLKGKTAIVTGASRGIGKAIAKGFAQEGANLVLASRSKNELEIVAKEIRRIGQHALVAPCDVTQNKQVLSMVKTTLEKYGNINILVNNAGAGAFRPGWATPTKTWHRMMDINAKSTFLCTKHAWKPLAKGGNGTIINISSTSGTRAYPMYAAYSASKWAQIGFTKVTAEEGKIDGIRVNAIAPGKVDTAMRKAISEDKNKMLKAQDCVGAAIFLASDESKYVTGQIIEIEWFGSDKPNGK